MVDIYEPEVITATDYYPFGQSMPGRSYENPEFTGTNDYRYAFNGNSLIRLHSVNSINVAD